ERAQRGDLLQHARRSDVAPDERRLCAEGTKFPSRLRGGAVTAEITDRHALGPVAREPECDRTADAARATRHEDVQKLRRGRGLSTGADEGTSSQPIRSGD